MAVSAIQLDEHLQDVQVTEDTLRVFFVDGRTLAVPLAWYPVLLQASVEQRAHWHVTEDGFAVRWPELDELIGVDELLWKGPAHHEANRALELAMRELAADEAYEAEALAWIEGTIGDVADLDEDYDIEAWSSTTVT